MDEKEKAVNFIDNMREHARFIEVKEQELVICIIEVNEIVRKGYAKCFKNDVYDFEKGKEIALTKAAIKVLKASKAENKQVGKEEIKYCNEQINSKLKELKNLRQSKAKYLREIAEVDNQVTSIIDIIKEKLEEYN